MSSSHQIRWSYFQQTWLEGEAVNWSSPHLKFPMAGCLASLSNCRDFYTMEWPLLEIGHLPAVLKHMMSLTLGMFCFCPTVILWGLGGCWTPDMEPWRALWDRCVGLKWRLGHNPDWKVHENLLMKWHYTIIVAMIAYMEHRVKYSSNLTVGKWVWQGCRT